MVIKIVIVKLRLIVGFDPKPKESKLRENISDKIHYKTFKVEILRYKTLSHK